MGDSKVEAKLESLIDKHDRYLITEVNHKHDEEMVEGLKEQRAEIAKTRRKYDKQVRLINRKHAKELKAIEEK